MIIYVFHATNACTIKVTELFFSFSTKFIVILFQYRNIIFRLNSMKIDLNDEKFLDEMESTSLQLMRQPIVLHAKGCFEINYTTLVEVTCFSYFFLKSILMIGVSRHSYLQLLGGIATYMLFYIQLIPKYYPNEWADSVACTHTLTYSEWNEITLSINVKRMGRGEMMAEWRWWRQ